MKAFPTIPILVQISPAKLLISEHLFVLSYTEIVLFGVRRF